MGAGLWQRARVKTERAMLMPFLRSCTSTAVMRLQLRETPTGLIVKVKVDPTAEEPVEVISTNADDHLNN